MNKRELIQAIKDYPDDAPVVIARDISILRDIRLGWYAEDHEGARIWAVSGDPRVIRLEL